MPIGGDRRVRIPQTSHGGRLGSCAGVARGYEHENGGEHGGARNPNADPGDTVVTGQPDWSVLHEGTWCGQGLPWWASVAAIAVMGLFLSSIAAMARALPRARQVFDTTR